MIISIIIPITESARKVEGNSTNAQRAQSPHIIKKEKTITMPYFFYSFEKLLLNILRRSFQGCSREYS